RRCDTCQDIGRLSQPTVACIIERALRDRNPREERDEGGERRYDKQQSPLSAALNDENPPECEREQEPDRPEEIQQDHESSPALRREEFRKHRWVDDQNPPEAKSRKEPEYKDAPR